MNESTKKESKLTLWFKKNFTIKTMVINALIAALYCVLTIVCGPLSYVGGSLQLRFSEILNLLVFFNPMYSIGLTIGCLMANIASLYGVFDIVLGTLGTLVACLFMILISKTIHNLLLASFMPCIVNALIVPFIVYLYTNFDGLSMEGYFIMFGWTFLGEFICVVCAGYPLFMILTKKYRGFYKLIDANTSLDFKF